MLDRGSCVAGVALKAIGMAEVNLLSYHLYHDGDGDEKPSIEKPSNEKSSIEKPSLKLGIEKPSLWRPFPRSPV